MALTEPSQIPASREAESRPSGNDPFCNPMVQVKGKPTDIPDANGGSRRTSCRVGCGVVQGLTLSGAGGTWDTTRTRAHDDDPCAQAASRALVNDIRGCLPR